MTTAHHAGTHRYAGDTREHTHPSRIAALAVGIAFLAVGVAGFIPGVTSNFDDLAGAGVDSQAKLLGLFQVSVAHNIVHLAFGLLGLLAARTVAASRIFLLGGGVLYLAITLYGSLVDRMSDANFLPFNTADNWLHLVLGLGMILLGVVTARAADGAVGRPAR